MRTADLCLISISISISPRPQNTPVKFLQVKFLSISVFSRKKNIPALSSNFENANRLHLQLVDKICLNPCACHLGAFIDIVSKEEIAVMCSYVKVVIL